VTDGARDQVNYHIPSMLISVLGSSEVLNSALSLKSEFLKSHHPTRAMRLDFTVFNRKLIDTIKRIGIVLRHTLHYV